jgi:hypothetical protein
VIARRQSRTCAQGPIFCRASPSLAPTFRFSKASARKPSAASATARLSRYISLTAEETWAMTMVAGGWTPGFSGAELPAAQTGRAVLNSTAEMASRTVASRVARVDRLDMRLPIEARDQPSKPMANRHP